jgi:hypothetical protein
MPSPFLSQGDLQEPDLRQYFSQYGEITDAVVSGSCAWRVSCVLGKQVCWLENVEDYLSEWGDYFTFNTKNFIKYFIYKSEVTSLKYFGISKYSNISKIQNFIN